MWTRWHTYADSRNLHIVKCQPFTLATGLCIHCIGLCFWLFSTWQVNTWTRLWPPLETNTSAGLILSLILPQAVWTSVSTVPHPHPPSVNGRKDERGRYEGLTRGRRKIVDFFTYQFDSCISSQFLCLQLILRVHTILHCVCKKKCEKSAAKRAIRPLLVTGWVSKLSTGVVVGATTEPHPSESQCASLAAAISALVPLLITSVDHLCAIS